MASILDEFSITNLLPEELKLSTRYFHVLKFGDPDRVAKRAYVITVQDEFYALFHESRGQSSQLSHDDAFQLVRVDELCARQVTQFFEIMSSVYVFATTSDGQLISWNTEMIRIANLPSSLKKVTYYEMLRGVNIVMISAMENSNFALDSSGLIYIFNERIVRTFALNEMDTFKYITKSGFLMLAVGNDDKIYSVGDSVNHFALDNVGRDVVIGDNVTIAKIEIVKDDIFVLSDHGELLRKKYEGVERIETEILFSDMFTNFHKLFLQSNEGVFSFQRTTGLIRTKYVNFFEYYLQEYEATPSTIRINDRGLLETVSFKLNDDVDEEEYLVQSWNFIYLKQGYLESEFNLVKKKLLGHGGFGQVFQVARLKRPDVSYAVKLINIEKKVDKNMVLREVRHMEYFDSQYIIELKDAWIEENHKLTLLFILMEYCPLTLSHIIEEKSKILDGMEHIDLAISVDLLSEIVNCISHVHKFEKKFTKPTWPYDDMESTGKQYRPMIHRDLKPDNILLSRDASGAHRLKLCDFGLISVLTNTGQLSIAGTETYMAPEVRDGLPYNHHADIYSFGVIARQLFKTIRKEEIPSNIEDIIEKCHANTPCERPDANMLIEAFENVKLNCDIDMLKLAEKNIISKLFRDINQAECQQNVAGIILNYLVEMDVELG